MILDLLRKSTARNVESGNILNSSNVQSNGKDTEFAKFIHILCVWEGVNKSVGNMRVSADIIKIVESCVFMATQQMLDECSRMSGEGMTRTQFSSQILEAKSFL